MQISLTIFTFIITVVLPIIGYIQFKIIVPNDLYLSKLKQSYDIIFIGTISIGVLLTVSRYYLYSFPQYSLKRAIVNLLNSLLVLVFLSLTSQIGKLDLTLKNSNLYLDLTGVFLLLIAVGALYLVKNLYDLIDFKLNQDYYTTLFRKKKIEYKITPSPLLKCPQCKYMCRSEWKKCPICHTKLTR